MFLELTDLNNNICLVSVDKIIRVRKKIAAYEEDDGTSLDATIIHLQEGELQYVKNTVEEIITKLRNFKYVS